MPKAHMKSAVAAVLNGAVVGTTSVFVLILGAMAIAWIFDVAVVIPGILHASIERQPAESLAVVFQATGPALPLIGVTAALATSVLCFRAERRRSLSEHQADRSRAPNDPQEHTFGKHQGSS